jgi:hypothetical protein
MTHRHVGRGRSSPPPLPPSLPPHGKLEVPAGNLSQKSDSREPVALRCGAPSIKSKADLASKKDIYKKEEKFVTEKETFFLLQINRPRTVSLRPPPARFVSHIFCPSPLRFEEAFHIPCSAFSLSSLSFFVVKSFWDFSNLMKDYYMLFTI